MTRNIIRSGYSKYWSLKGVGEYGEKTVFFEDKYGVSIDDFHSTSDVDRFLAERLCLRQLEVIRSDTNISNSRTGNVLEVELGDIDKEFEEVLKNS